MEITIEKPKRNLNKLLITCFTILLLGLFVGIILLLKLFISDDNVKLFNYSTSISLLIIALCFIIFSTFKKNTFPLITLLLSTQLAIPVSITSENAFPRIAIFLGLIILGMIIHFIRFKPKFKLGSFFIALILMLIPLILGPLGRNLNKTLLVITFIVFGLFSYVFFTSTIDKPSLGDISYLLIMFGITLVANIYLSYFLYKDQIGYFNSYIFENSNIYLVILLMIIPFTILPLINIKDIKTGLGAFLSIIAFIIFTYETTSFSLLAALLIGIIIILMFILGLVKCEKKVPMIIGFVLLIAVVLFFTINIVFIIPFEIIDSDVNTLESVLDDIKLYIYEIGNQTKEINNYINNKDISWFGKGSYLVSKNEYEASMRYNILSTLLYSGIIGIICCFIFTFYKYFKLLRVKTTLSLTICISLFVSGIIIFILPVFNSLIYISFIILLFSMSDYYINEKLLCEYGDD